jgi:hypothetical protein
MKVVVDGAHRQSAAMPLGQLAVLLLVAGCTDDPDSGTADWQATGDMAPADSEFEQAWAVRKTNGWTIDATPDSAYHCSGLVGLPGLLEIALTDAAVATPGDVPIITDDQTSAVASAHLKLQGHTFTTGQIALVHTSPFTLTFTASGDGQGSTVTGHVIAAPRCP